MLPRSSRLLRVYNEFDQLMRVARTVVFRVSKWQYLWDNQNKYIQRYKSTSNLSIHRLAVQRKFGKAIEPQPGGQSAISTDSENPGSISSKQQRVKSGSIRGLLDSYLKSFLKDLEGKLPLPLPFPVKSHADLHLNAGATNSFVASHALRQEIEQFNLLVSVVSCTIKDLKCVRGGAFNRFHDCSVLGLTGQQLLRIRTALLRNHVPLLWKRYAPNLSSLSALAPGRKCMPRPLEHIPGEEFVLRATTFVEHLQQRRSYLEHTCCRVNAECSHINLRFTMYFLFFPARFLAMASYVTGSVLTVGAEELHFQIMTQASSTANPAKFLASGLFLHGCAWDSNLLCLH